MPALLRNVSRRARPYSLVVKLPSTAAATGVTAAAGQLSEQRTVAEVIGRHIVYVSPHFYLIPVMVLYLAATCVSCFFSSHGFVKLFGVLTLLSFIAAYLIHILALVSIWCFFAAILSLLIYLHLRFRQLGGFPGNVRFRRSFTAAP
jgi:hypothetical protein